MPRMHADGPLLMHVPWLFCAGRMTNKQRKQTLTEELLADAELSQTRKKRFGALQAERQRWASKGQKRKKVGYERKRVYKRPRH